MPARFAYVMAVGLFLVGGYGALSWLAAPEPVKIVAKAKPKPPPHYEASSEVTSLETSSSTINDDGQVTSGSNHPASSAQTEASVAASQQSAQPQPSGPSQAQQGGAANAEVLRPKPSGRPGRQFEPCRPFWQTTLNRVSSQSRKAAETITSPASQ
jgi:hypothetical protein